MDSMYFEKKTKSIPKNIHGNGMINGIVRCTLRTLNRIVKKI